MDNRSVPTQEWQDEINFWINAFKLNTCIPAIVDEFDPATQRVSATPAIKAKYIAPDQTVSYIEYPKITNIPLALIKSSGLVVTYPIKKGQNCTLIFSQRSIDNFLLDGTKPAEPFEGDNPKICSLRCMDLTDALCFPGVVTNNEAISNYNNDALEMRNRDGTTKVSVTQNGLNFIQGGATISLSNGEVSINASAINITGPTTITGQTTINGHDFDTHTHSGVTPGQGNTGGVV